MECEEHENIISLVCVTCENKLLCIECVDDHPKGHHFSSVKAVTKKVKSEKHQLLRSIDEDVSTLKKEIAAVRATRKQQDDIEKEENQKINDHRATIHSIVDEIANNQLKFSEIQKIKNISLLQEDEEFITKQLQERIAYGEVIRDMLESTDGTEMLQKTNKINPVTPLSFPPTPLQALKFCAGQINEDQIRFMFGRMMDSPEEAEVVSDFVGSIRLKSPDIDDSKKQVIESSEENYLALQFFCRDEGFRNNVETLNYDKGQIVVHCDDENVMTVIESKLKRFTHMNKRELSLSQNEQLKIGDVIKAVHGSISGVFCYQLEGDEGKRLWIMCEEYNGMQQARHKIERVLGRIQQTDKWRNRRFDTKPQQQMPNDDVDDKHEDEKPSSYQPYALDLKNVELTTSEGLDIKIYVGSILHLDVDCIVNAANENLQHGGGIAHVISQAAGYEFDRESRDFIIQNGPLEVGDCCTTTAGRLRYKGVIHTVGPRWRSSDQYECLRELKEAVLNTLFECDFQNYKSVAIPAISSGIFGVPIELCTQEYYKAVEEYSKQRTNPCSLREVHFVDKDPGMVYLIHQTFAKSLGMKNPSSLTHSVQRIGGKNVSVPSQNRKTSNLFTAFK